MAVQRHDVGDSNMFSRTFSLMKTCDFTFLISLGSDCSNVRIRHQYQQHFGIYHQSILNACFILEFIEHMTKTHKGI